MEKSTIDRAEICRKMTTLGVTQTRLGEAASLPSSAMSVILSGKVALGPTRHARIQDALHRLALEVATQASARAEAARQIAAETAPQGDDHDERTSEPPAKKVEPRGRHL